MASSGGLPGATAQPKSILKTRSTTVPLSQPTTIKTKKITIEDEPKWDKPTSWCWPFIIYVVLGLIAMIANLYLLFTSKKVTIGSGVVYVIFKLLFFLFFGWLIYYLCKKGHTGWAWVVLLLPLIISVIFTLFIFGILGAFGLGYKAGTGQNGQNSGQ